MNKYAILRVLLAVAIALAMLVNWLIFQTPFTLWALGFVSGMVVAYVWREITT